MKNIYTQIVRKIGFHALDTKRYIDGIKTLAYGSVLIQSLNSQNGVNTLVTIL